MAERESNALIWWIFLGVIVIAALLHSCNPRESTQATPSAPSAPVAEAAPAPVSAECIKIVEAAERQGSIRPGTADRSGATILVNEAFAAAPADWQQIIAECTSHYLAKGQDRWIRKIRFVNQRTGVTYGTIENTRYRVGE